MSAASRSRESPARCSLRVKVEALEALAAQGNPNGDWYPGKVRELVLWTDLERGFRPWSSFSVAAINGPNSDLRRRYDAAIATLSMRAAPTRRRAIRRSEDHVHAIAEVKALSEQNVVLIAEKHALTRQLLRLEQQITILRSREVELTSKLNKLLPLDRQQRAFHPDK